MYNICMNIVCPIKYEKQKKLRLRSIFYSLKYRSSPKTVDRFPLYSGKGVRCEWKSIQEFLDDMSESYFIHLEKWGPKNTTIDRIDVNGNYSKVNCRWATRSQQSSEHRTRRPDAYTTYNDIYRLTF